MNKFSTIAHSNLAILQYVENSHDFFQKKNRNLDRICHGYLSGDFLTPSDIYEALSGLEIDYYCEIHDRDSFSGSVVYGLECYEINSSQGKSVWAGVLFDVVSEDEVNDDAGLPENPGPEDGKGRKNQEVDPLAHWPVPTIHGCFLDLLSYHERYGFVVVQPEKLDLS